MRASPIGLFCGPWPIINYSFLSASSIGDANDYPVSSPRSQTQEPSLSAGDTFRRSGLEGKEDYVIVDGNLDTDPGSTIARIAAENDVEFLAVSVMPGPQMVAAIPVCREFRQTTHRCRSSGAGTSLRFTPMLR